MYPSAFNCASHLSIEVLRKQWEMLDWLGRVEPLRCLLPSPFSFSGELSIRRIQSSLWMESVFIAGETKTIFCWFNESKDETEAKDKEVLANGISGMPGRKLIEAVSFFCKWLGKWEGRRGGGRWEEEESGKVNDAFHSSSTSLMLTSIISFVQVQLIQCKLASWAPTAACSLWAVCAHCSTLPSALHRALCRAGHCNTLWDCTAQRRRSG